MTIYGALGKKANQITNQIANFSRLRFGFVFRYIVMAKGMMAKKIFEIKNRKKKDLLSFIRIISAKALKANAKVTSDKLLNFDCMSVFTCSIVVFDN